MAIIPNSGKKERMCITCRALFIPQSDRHNACSMKCRRQHGWKLHTARLPEDDYAPFDVHDFMRSLHAEIPT